MNKDEYINDHRSSCVWQKAKILSRQISKNSVSQKRGPEKKSFFQSKIPKNKITPKSKNQKKICLFTIYLKQCKTSFTRFVEYKWKTSLIFFPNGRQPQPFFLK